METSYATSAHSFGTLSILFEYFVCLISSLQHFLSAMLRLSKKRVPLLYEVIPVIDILNEKLEDVAENTSLLPSVRAGAMKGLAILNKYYLKTDESIMYRIAMSKLPFDSSFLCIFHIVRLVLNPKYKLKYFESKNWPQSWIDAALEVLRDQWKMNYKLFGSVSQGNNPAEGARQSVC